MRAYFLLLASLDAVLLPFAIEGREVTANLRGNRRRQGFQAVTLSLVLASSSSRHGLDAFTDNRGFDTSTCCQRCYV